MSNPLAIAAVTATLRNLLTKGIAADPDLQNIFVTIQPVDRARQAGETKNQLNLFLYHVLPSGAWRNMEMPGRVRPGETAPPPVALNLYYLLTAYGQDDDSLAPFSHQVLGRAMSILNDRPLLGADEIKAALANNDLWRQIERVRFTLHPFPQDELSKLWTGFQTGFRLSVAYEAAVVLIDSATPVRAPLPVLSRGQKRGDQDTGVDVRASMAGVVPTLTDLQLPGKQTSVKVGDTITLQGALLSGDKVRVSFTHPSLPNPINIDVSKTATDSTIAVKIPGTKADWANWAAGIYTLTVVVTKKDANGNPVDRTTNALALPIAPTITSQMPMAVQAVAGNATIDLQCKPFLRPGQHVSLFLDDREFVAPDLANAANQVSFIVPRDPGHPLPYRARLRVDGVDSPIIDWSKAPPQFDDTQKVTIQ